MLWLMVASLPLPKSLEGSNMEQFLTWLSKFESPSHRKFAESWRLNHEAERLCKGSSHESALSDACSKIKEGI